MNNWKTLILSALVCTNTAFAAQVVDKVAAIVDNGVVLESDVDGMMNSVKAQNRSQDLPDDATLHHQVMERLIMDQILLQMAKRAGIEITDSDVDNAIEDIAQKNRLTVDQMRDRLAADHISFQAYREQIRKEMLIAEVRNSEVRRRVTILPQEVDSLAKQMSNQNSADTELNLSNILIALPENPSQQQVDMAEQKTNAIIQQLHKGADFAKLAVSYSSDAQALKGGNMGWNRIEELPSLLASSLQTAKKGDIIGPIRSGVGFHIIKVNDIRGGAQGSVAVTEVHARHILLRNSPMITDDQARAKLQDIARKIKTNQLTFEAAAKQYSEDPGSAQRGGDLGWAVPTAYDPAFRDALISLRKGQISEPIQSSFGWHLIQLLDTRQVDRTDSSQKERAYRMLFNRKFSEEAQSWMQEQRAGAYVKILDGSDAKSSNAQPAK